MSLLIDLTGKRFTSLTVIGRDKTRGPQIYWRCVCDCGKRTTVVSQSLRVGHSRSCGCQIHTPRRPPKRLMPEYSAWNDMKMRCLNKNRPVYPLYGGRGITICGRWKYSFDNFLKDMGLRPSEKHSLDRIDNDGNYEPGNCRWATKAQQMSNRRNTRFVVFRTKKMSLVDAVRKAGSVVHHEAAWGRITRCGWSVEEAVTTPRLHESPNSKARKAAKRAYVAPHARGSNA